MTVPPTPQDLLAFTFATVSGLLGLGTRSLSPKERCAAAGTLFAGAQAFVRAVAQALAAGHLGDRVQAGVALGARQDRALCWLYAAETLALLSQECRDSYLAEQTDAIRDASAVVAALRYQAAAPGLSPRGLFELRLLCLPLHRALSLLRRRKGRRPAPAPRRCRQVLVALSNRIRDLNRPTRSFSPHPIDPPPRS